VSVRPRKLTPGGVVVGVAVCAFGTFGLLAATVALWLGGILCAVFPPLKGGPFSDLALDDRSVTCPGELTAVETDLRLFVDGQPAVRLRYEYEPGGPTLEGANLVADISPAASLPVGSPLTIEVHPEAPYYSRIQGERATPGTGIGMLGGVLAFYGPPGILANLGLVTVGLLFAFFGAHRRAREAHT
jgi:hypothetical protein